MTEEQRDLTAYLLEELRKARSGEDWKRTVSPRCPNIRRHWPGLIPMPCPDCYAIETISRRVPWSELGWDRQPGATG